MTLLHAALLAHLHPSDLAPALAALAVVVALSLGALRGTVRS